LAAEFERLKDEIESKEYEILEKDKALRVLQEEHAELKEVSTLAQQDAQQNQTLIDYLNETNANLKAELKSMKKDKETFKSAFGVIVRNESRLQKALLKKTLNLQREAAIQRKMEIEISDLQRERMKKHRKSLLTFRERLKVSGKLSHLNINNK